MEVIKARFILLNQFSKGHGMFISAVFVFAINVDPLIQELLCDFTIVYILFLIEYKETFDLLN